MNHENKLIKLSMITLFLSLLIVYLLLWQLKGDKIKTSQEDLNLTSNYSGIVIKEKSGNQINLVQPDNNILDTYGSGNSDVLRLENLSTTTNTNTSSPSMNTSTGIIMFSGTKLYYGKIDSIDKLGIKYQYALIDNQGIYYINISNSNYDINQIVKALKGTTYTMTTEQEILENKLFGNKIIYINLPEYSNKLVVMIIVINNQSWLLQIDYTLYHKSKQYLKSLFIQ